MLTEKSSIKFINNCFYLSTNDKSNPVQLARQVSSDSIEDIVLHLQDGSQVPSKINALSDLIPLTDNVAASCDYKINLGEYALLDKEASQSDVLAVVANLFAKINSMVELFAVNHDHCLFESRIIFNRNSVKIKKRKSDSEFDGKTNINFLLEIGFIVLVPPDKNSDSRYQAVRKICDLINDAVGTFFGFSDTAKCFSTESWGDMSFSFDYDSIDVEQFIESIAKKTLIYIDLFEEKFSIE